MMLLLSLAEVYDFGLTAAEFHAFFDASLWRTQPLFFICFS
ncbi:unnamed protein product [Arabidopsis halleri]